jgi:adenylate cyclase
MEPRNVQRKLAAILAADIAGYSRLMGSDEAGTLAQLTVHRKELIDPKIAEHHGRIVKTTGDGILVEFASVVNAVQCAVEVQRAMARRNADVPKDLRVEFRVGINIGDIIIEGDDIYGDGVNVATRLEELAQPGRLCISGTAFDHVKNKLSVGFESLGNQQVKNITDPVHVYRVRLEPEAAGAVKVVRRAGTRRWPWAAAALVVLVGGAAIWNFYLRSAASKLEPASVEKMAFPLPKKPSIAVLPFINMSEDPEQEHFADGITENIITALSQVPDMFVIARNSTFTYKDKAVKVQQVAEEFGVRYILEGSVQRSGDRVRINVQLIDALKGHHLWSERYDRKFKDIFALQDDITENVVAAMQVKLTEGEQARIRRRQTDNLEAYQYFLRGLVHRRPSTKVDNAQTRRLFEKAVSLDPNFAGGWEQIARTHIWDVRLGWTDTPPQSIARAEELLQKALAIDDSHAETYSLLSVLAMQKRQHEKAIFYCEKALALNSNEADSTARCARTLEYSGRAEEAIALVKRAMRLSPYYPNWYLFVLGVAYRMTGRYDEAIAAAKGFLNRNPNHPYAHVLLAVSHFQAGRQEEARATVAELLRRNPKFSVKKLAKPLGWYKNPAEAERILDAARKAGLPE